MVTTLTWLAVSSRSSAASPPDSETTAAAGGTTSSRPCVPAAWALLEFHHNQSTLQDLVGRPACWVYCLLAELNFEPGALLVPLAVAIHAALMEARETVSPGCTCLSLDSGAIGLLCDMAACRESC